jgi:hypothetical protein
MRIRRVAKRFDFAQFLAALRELVKRFKFQRKDPFSSGRTPTESRAAV